MSDLLRLARAARSFGFLVGLGRYGSFRTFAYWLACVGIGLAVGGATFFGASVALCTWFAVWLVRSRNDSLHRRH